METKSVEELSQRILQMQDSIKEVAMKRDKELGKIGNIIHDSCPVFKDEVPVFYTR